MTREKSGDKTNRSKENKSLKTAQKTTLHENQAERTSEEAKHSNEKCLKKFKISQHRI